MTDFHRAMERERRRRAAWDWATDVIGAVSLIVATVAGIIVAWGVMG